MKKPYVAPEFKALQAEWYGRLKDAGFNDIEDAKRERAPLKCWHDKRFKKISDVKIETSRSYYDRAADLLHRCQFKTPTHRRIWELHCQGLPNRKIAEELAKESDLIHYAYVKVGYIIHEISIQMSEVIVRPFIPSQDVAMIYDSWPKAIYYGLHKKTLAKEDKRHWFENFFEMMKTVLPIMDVRIACMSDDPGTILGYSIINRETEMLEFVYVKGLVRRQGIATLLTKDRGITQCNVTTKVGRLFVAAHPEWKEV